jgi:hypothetical protein
MVTPGHREASGIRCRGASRSAQRSDVFSGEAVLRGEAGGCSAGGYAELPVDGVEVAIDGVGTYEEVSGNLRVGETLGYEL